jgi:hypothetical protein
MVVGDGSCGCVAWWDWVALAVLCIGASAAEGDAQAELTRRQVQKWS